MSISRLLFLGFGLLLVVLTTLSIITYTQLRSIDASVAATGDGLALIVTQREPLRRTGFKMETSSNELAIVPLEYFRDRSISMTERIKRVNEAFKTNYGEFQALADDADKLTGAKVNESFDNLKRYAEESVARHDDHFNLLTEMYAKATALEDVLGQLQQPVAAEQINQEQVDRLRAALRMQIHLHELRLAVRTYQVDRDPKYRQEVRDTVTRFDELTEVYADANPSAGDLATLQRVAADFKVLSDLAIKILDVTDTQSEHFDKLRQEFVAINKTLDEELQPNIQKDVEAARLGASMAVSDAVKSVDTAGWVLLGATLIGIAVGGGAATVIARQITRPVASMVEAAEALAQGDLTRPALDEGTNETGRLAAAFNQMVASLRSILGESKTISAEVASASNEIATSAQQQLASLNQTATSLNQITTTAEEFKATMQEFADRARAVQEAADDTTKQTADGRTLTQEAAARIKRVRGNSQTAGQSVLKLSEQMQRIGEITATVNEIAEQTKLLALNASIEAARAGEDGRGFAVVATQVRELANQSKESAGRIEALIGGTQKSMQDVVTKIEEGSRLSEDSVDSVQQMAQAFDEIAQAIEQTREAMSQINTGARQQEDGIVELVSSITEIDSGSRESVAAAEQTQKAIVAVDQRIRALNESIARFRT